jgi:hypothetical protein
LTAPAPPPTTFAGPTHDTARKHHRAAVWLPLDRKHPFPTLLGLRFITDDELLLIQQILRRARGAEEGRGMAHPVNEQGGMSMNNNRQTALHRNLGVKVAEEKSLSAQILERLVGKVEEYSEMQPAHGLQQDLQRIPQEDVRDGQFRLSR